MKNRMLAVLIAAGITFAFSSNTLFGQAKPLEKKAAPKTAIEVKKELKKNAAAYDKAGDKACCQNAMVCSVSGQPAKKEFFSEYKGQKVYFCCANCKAAFDKDPAKYEAKIKKCDEACKQETKGTAKKVEKPAQK